MAQFENIDFPGWEVIRKIGEGSFGGVYEIHRTLPGGRVEKCALKKLSVPRNDGEIQELISQSFSTESITAHYKNQMGELVNEYSLTQELSSCKNVVGCYDVRFIQHDDGIGWDIYIRMELLHPLRQALSTEYQEATVLRLGLDMCNALLACQEHSIIHRDIKPENILVSDRGEFKLGDFGIAKVSERTGTGTMTGTMGYMAPEVANRQHYGPQADIYSLGMVLYWMMNRRTLPFLPYPPAIPSAIQRQEAANRRLAGEAFPPPAHGSAELKAIVMKACAYSPAERCQSAQELQQALAACADRPLARPQDPDAAIPVIPDIPVSDEPTQCGTVGTFRTVPAQNEPVTPPEPPRPAAPPKAEKPKREKYVPRKKRSLKWLWLPVCLLLLCGGIFGVKQATAASSASKYRAAQQRLDAGEYFTAARAFEALGDYSDSAEKAQEARGGIVADQQTVPLAAGEYHIAGLRSDGTVTAAGRNKEGQCKVSGWKNIVAVSVGNYHTVGLCDDGTVVSAGRENEDLRDADNWTDIVAISAGAYHTVGLRSDGTVVAAGRNYSDVCEVGDWTDIVAVSAGEYHTVGLRGDGTVVATGLNSYGECDVDGWTDIIAVSVGNGHTVGLRSDGTVVAAGQNNKGQCDVDGWTDIVAVSAGYAHTVGLRSDGTVVAVGWNLGSQRDGVNDWTDIVAVSAGYICTVGLHSDGTVVATGTYQQQVSDWKDIAAAQASQQLTDAEARLAALKQAQEQEEKEQSYQAAQILMNEGNYSAAAESFAALGDYSDSAQQAQTARQMQEQAEKEQSYQAAQTLMNEGNYSAAAEAFTALGDYSDSAQQAQSANWLRDMATRYQAALALMDSGKYMQAMWAFKALDYLDSQEKVQEARTRFVASQRTSLSAGCFYTLGLRNDSAVVVTGSNGGGFHGETNWMDIVEISAGGGHNAGLRSDGTVVTTGSYSNGERDTGSWTNIVAVSAGWDYTVGLRADGTVVATGWNENGECGTDSWTDIVAVSAGVVHTMGLRSDGTVVTTAGWLDTSSWTDIVAISAGDHAVGLRSDGTVVATGSNEYGQCNVSGWTDIVAVSAGSAHTVGLRADGTVVATGWNKNGECDTDSWTDIVAVSAGNTHTVGLRSDGTVVATGSNDYGQCDVGDWTDIATGPRNIAA